MGFLIDTCVWIDVEQGALAPLDVARLTHDEPVFMSPVTIAELKFGADSAADPRIRHRRLAALARLRRKPLLSIDGDTGEVFGQISAQLKSTGRQVRSRVQDLWLASQAIQHSLRFLTRNPGDFQDIPGLDLVSYKLGKTN
jgi:predicted nucleic acid-binding protein